ncbi:MAG: translation initiation factor IF-2 N-terminal domain-containing protein, partial [Bacteroidaceae bacterium]|nr:translation initiation factor IF-2 N-terminal domain-containing protein [Bacteroidaceae bacterium]
MTIRLNKVTRDLNVGITTVVEFLQKKGHTIEANPNAKITEEQYAELVKEFSKDKNLKKESEKFIQERQNKERNKPTVSIAEEPKKEEEVDLRPSVKLKPVGKIDLDNLNKRAAAPKKEESVKEEKVVVAQEPVVVEKPLVKEEKKEPVQEVVVAPVKEETEPQEVHMEKETSEKINIQEEDGVFKIRPTELKTGINVLGKIDLDALNQSTRPKKKSKEEKRKERDEKEKVRQEQRKQMKDAIIKEIRKTDDKNAKDTDDEANKKKKRNRIGKEKVDINAPGNQGGFRKDGKDASGKGNNAQGKQGKDQGKPNKDRFKKPAPKVEVSDEDVAKQVKETLARLTNKTKNKAAKYRKEKRDNVRDRMMEQEEMEQEESKILKLTEFVTANELANMMDIPVTQVIGTCMSIGMMVSINQRLDA